MCVCVCVCVCVLSSILEFHNYIHSVLIFIESLKKKTIESNSVVKNM